MKKRLLYCATLIVSLMLTLFSTRVQADTKYKAEDLVTLGMAEDIAELKERGILRIGVIEGEQPGFLMEDSSGNLSGFDIELARNIAGALELEPEIVRVEGGYDGLLPAAISGDVDIVISTFSHTIDRLQYIDFSDPYLTTNYATVVNKAAMVRAGIWSNPIPYMKENTVDIALPKGTSHTPKVLSLFPNANIIEVESAEEAFLMVSNDEAFATFSSEAELFLYGLYYPSAGIYTKGYSFTDINDEFCVGISRKYPRLKELINLYLHTSKQLTEKELEDWFYDNFANE